MHVSKLFERDGFAEIAGAISRDDCRSVACELRKPRIHQAGTRNLLDHEWCHALALRLKCNYILADLLSVDYVAVQCTLFDKSAAQPWKVPYHQDLSIPVRKRIDSPGCESWSEKEGAWYTQPPARLLAALVAVRVHLDDCGAENGPLRVISGSHRVGRIAEADVSAFVAHGGEVVCSAKVGDVLVMSPLLLHASAKPTNPSSRRVLHFVFGPPELPLGLEWRRMI